MLAKLFRSAMSATYFQIVPQNKHTPHLPIKRKYGKILTIVESGWINEYSFYYSFNFSMLELFS